jgi:metal-responsive CopG/Arc/MetJ family transcriptional regulator
VKTAISVPDAIFAEVEEAARGLGISRSEFYATAAQRWVDELRRRQVTAQIDATLDNDHDAEEDTAGLMAEAARRAFTRADGS